MSEGIAENAPAVTTETAGVTGVTDAAALVGSVVADVKYDMKLPDNSKLDPAIIERTTAIARKSGLSKEAGQELFAHTVSESEKYADTAAKSAIESDRKSRSPGGEVWKAQVAEWEASALADKDLGGGKPEQLKQIAELGKRFIATYGGKYAASMDKYLTDSGLGSNPVVLGFFAELGKKSGEDKFVFGETRAPGSEGDAPGRAYPGMLRSKP